MRFPRLAAAAATALVLGSASRLTAAISLAVDASDAPRKIFHVRETIPYPRMLYRLYP